MSTYIVGDIQGCFSELQQLLELVAFDASRDELWLTGDLVARGPSSLETIRFVHSLGQAAKTVLGNHDLHLLATDAGLVKSKKKDKLDALFSAHDKEILLDWLRHQPLLLRHPEHNFIMVHAGIPPQWDTPLAEQLANEVEVKLQSDDYLTLLQHMYGNQPSHWDPLLAGFDRTRFIINAFTRMRYCYPDGSLDFSNKLDPEATKNVNLHPWFEVEVEHKDQTPIIFGHWAALMGKTGKEHIIGLDTGCVWGNTMTMLRWEDKQYYSLPCPLYCS